MQTATELTYNETAEILGFTPRHVRRILRKHKALCPPIRYSHVRVRFAFERVMRLKKKLREDAINGSKN